MVKRILMLLGAAVLTPCFLAQAAAQSQAQKRFSDLTTVFVVEIPVQVERDGVPVRGLTRDDFEVRDGRKKLEIVGFEEIDLEVVGAAEDKAAVDLPVAARRHFLFLFDLALSNPAKVARAQDAATRLVAGGLHPSDLAAVATYSSRTGVALTLGFTSDRRQLEAAIRSLGLPQLVNRTQDPLSLTLTDLVQRPSGSDAASQRGVDAEAEIESIIQSIEGEITTASRGNQMLAFTSGLADLARMMGSVEGRKHVVLLSEGFDAARLVGTGVSTSAERERVQQVSAAAMEGRIWEVGTDARYGDTSDQGFLRKMTAEFVRTDCAIHSVDIGGLRASGAEGGDKGWSATGQDGLFIMAKETGGSYYQNFNEFDEAMGRMLERTSVTYVLAIQPDKLESDGSYHRLKVKLKNDLKGASLTHRPGYFAPKPQDQIAAIEKRLNIAGLVLGGDDGGVVRTAVLAAPYDVQSDRAYVPVLIEVDGSTLLGSQQGGVVPAEIYVYGINRAGEVADFFTRALGLNLAEMGPTLRKTGLKYWGHLELPPGDYVVRVVVRNDASGLVGVRKLSLRVADVAGGEPALWPPMLPEAPGKWVFGREKPEEQGDFPYPFLADGQPFIPAARPVIASGEEFQLVLAGYHLGAAPQVSAELFAADGRRVEGLGVALGAAGAASGEGPDHWLARFSPGRIAPGDYRLVVTMVGDGGVSASSEISVAVGS